MDSAGGAWGPAVAVVRSPVGMVGADASGTVLVALDADGLPDTVRVTALLPPLGSDTAAGAGTGTGVGTAVESAFAAAHRVYVAATAAEVGQAVREWVSTRNDWQIAVAARADRRVSAVAALDRAQSLWTTVGARRPVCGVGRSVHGAITMTLTRPAAVSCVADPRWVAAAGPAMVTAALGEALSDARRHLAAAMATPSPADEAAGLVATLIAELQDAAHRAPPHRPERSGQPGAGGLVGSGWTARPAGSGAGDDTQPV